MPLKRVEKCHRDLAAQPVFGTNGKLNPIGHISGTPSRGYQVGTLDAASAIEKCSENETRGLQVQSDSCQSPSQALFLKRHLLQTPQATVHSSDVADCWLAWHSMPGRKGAEFGA